MISIRSMCCCSPETRERREEGRKEGRDGMIELIEWDSNELVDNAVDCFLFLISMGIGMMLFDPVCDCEGGER